MLSFMKVIVLVVLAVPGGITPASTRSSLLPVAVVQALGSFELILAPEGSTSISSTSSTGTIFAGD